ncbi:hypothetical protein Acr_12g0002730 [Actinidia rufa]|uniref:Retrovirus-related Pol polyprotein from transposon TNT 1-94 n=1 Tax=Actinidia rufa TaxID=165716 RepID=A0A7J0FGA3_9ERIC|nr:hypothetical protein Acr_12g0002730 [Actinidia rufa]
MEALPPSSMVKNGGMNELSHELIFSALWPINLESFQREKKWGVQCRLKLCKEYRALLAELRKSCLVYVVDVGRVTDSSLRYEAPALNGVKIGLQTSPHAPPEVRHVRSTHPTRARGRRRLNSTRHAPPRALELTHAHARALRRVQQPLTCPHAPGEWRQVAPTCPRAQQRMEDILFCKDLHDPLENKGEKSIEKKDEEWTKMNRKTIGLIRQCIRHEVFHHVAQETSAYELWTKLEKMYQAKTSRNKALLMRRLVNLKLQRGTVPEHTSEFQNLVNQLASIDFHFNNEMQALLLLSYLPESWETLVVSLSNSVRNCPKYKTHMQSSETASASASVMTDSDNDAFLVSSADENPDWTNKVVGKGTVRFRMTDGRSVTLNVERIAAKGGILRIFKGNKEMLRGRKIRGLYRLERSVQTGKAAVRHGSSDIRRKNGQEKQQVHTGTQSKRRDTWRSQSGTRAQGDALRHVRKSNQTRLVQPVQDVHRKAQRKETKSILKSCTSTGATSPKRVSFALDLISGSDLFRCVHKGGERKPQRLAKSYRRAGPEVIEMDNLKISDYPPMGWRERLLDPAHRIKAHEAYLLPSPRPNLKPYQSPHSFC